MTSDQDKPVAEPENGSEPPVEEPKERFNPFLHEDDMFKIVLGVGAGVLVVAVLAVIANALL
jgi:hypothetical protein